MIIAKLSELQHQAALTPLMREGVAFLTGLDVDTLQDGEWDIAEGTIHVQVRYHAQPKSKPLSFEGHRQVVELQYPLASRIMVAWAPLEAVAIGKPYDAAKDAWGGGTAPSSEITPVIVRAGYVAVLYPEDAHALGATPDGAPVRKVSLKVRLG